MPLAPPVTTLLLPLKRSMSPGLLVGAAATASGVHG